MDPRETTPQDRQGHLSPLMQAKALGDKGSGRCFCPFGCGVEDCDEHGYCRHLVGFTNDKQTMEPMRVDEARGVRKVYGAESEPCKKGDKFEKITVSWRVYRDVDKG